MIICVLTSGFYFFRYRDNPSNNLKNARRFHESAIKLNEAGHSEKSDIHYAISDVYRRKFMKKRTK